MVGKKTMSTSHFKRLAAKKICHAPYCTYRRVGGVASYVNLSPNTNLPSSSQPTFVYTLDTVSQQHSVNYRHIALEYLQSNPIC